MANSFPDAWSRIRALPAATSGVSRPMTTARLQDFTDLCRGEPYSVPEEAPPAFVLETESGIRHNGMISAPGGLRTRNFKMYISVQAGMGEGVTNQSASNADAYLDQLVEECIQVIEAPTNWNKSTTGIWRIGELRDGSRVNRNGRRHCTLTGEVDVYQTYAEL